MTACVLRASISGSVTRPTAPSGPYYCGVSAGKQWWGGWGPNPRPADYESGQHRSGIGCLTSANAGRVDHADANSGTY
jgi:hypothetical protein